MHVTLHYQHHMKTLAISIALLIGAISSNAQQPSKPRPEQPQDSLVFKCQKQKSCRFHVVGALTLSPKGVFSVAPSVWSNFSEADRVVYKNLAKIWLDQIASNPEGILTDKQNGGAINQGAPILPRASANIQRSLKRVEFLVSTSKMNDGFPGWSEGQVIPELEVLR